MSECNECCDTAPVKFGVEDISFGCGTEEQIRSCKKVPITKVNASHIVLCESGRPVEYYLQELRRMFPFIECGVFRPTMDIGNWEDAVISADINSCAIGLPNEIEQRAPMMEGDVTKYNNCLWISLSNNNTDKPSRVNYINFCDLQRVIECVLPEGQPTLCERVENLESTSIDNYVTNIAFIDGELVLTRSGTLSNLQVGIAGTDGNTFITNIVKNTSETGYIATRSDGVGFPIDFPKGKSSYGSFDRIRYESPGNDIFVSVPVASIQNGGALPSCILTNGKAVVVDDGVYSVQLQLTHHGEIVAEDITTCRLSLKMGPLGEVNTFFATNNYNNGDNFQQATASWTGKLQAGDEIEVLIDAGVFHLWHDPRYTKLTVTKVGL